MTAQAAQNQQGQVTTIASLRKPAESLPDVSAGFGSLKSFELMQRMAGLLCASTLVPAPYQSFIVKLDKYGNVTDKKENPNALANAVVALNMSQRIGADPLMVMQNLHVIEGRPSWSSQFVIAAINSCGKFSPLRFEIKDLGPKTVEYTEFYWEERKRYSRDVSIDIQDFECIAWALEKETGVRLEGPPVTIELAVKEGWYTKNGSKWQTMPMVMIRYRAASFFGKLYAPDLLMGIKTVEEEQDIIKVDPDTGKVVGVTTETLRADMKKAEVATEVQDPLPADTPEEQRAVVAPEDTPKEQPQVAKQETASNDVEKKEESTGTGEAGSSKVVSARVTTFMKEINQTSKGGSMAVDTWRAKHNNRVANACGGVDSEDYKEIMSYADRVFSALEHDEKEAEAQGGAAQKGGAKDGSVF